SSTNGVQSRTSHAKSSHKGATLLLIPKTYPYTSDEALWRHRSHKWRGQPAQTTGYTQGKVPQGHCFGTILANARRFPLPKAAGSDGKQEAAASRQFECIENHPGTSRYV